MIIKSRQDSVKIQTLTSMWTVGVNPRRCDRIGRPSILGLIRWWKRQLSEGYRDPFLREGINVKVMSKERSARVKLSCVIGWAKT